MEILRYIGMGLVAVGTIFLFLGALGIYRMPDVYNRMQAGTKATTLGAIGVILGVGFMQPEWIVKTIIIIIFIAIANPLSSHALARAAYRNKQKPYMKNKVDAYEKIVYDEPQKKEEE